MCDRRWSPVNIPQDPTPDLHPPLQGEWFYVKNIDWSVPLFTERKLESHAEWTRDVESRYKKKVDYMTREIVVLKGQGLSGERLIHTLMQRWLQPLMARQNLMWKYAGESDPDRHSNEVLSQSEVDARVNDITAG